MRLAISNLAWDVTEDAEVAVALGEFSVDAIDVVPGKYFPAPQEVEDAAIQRVKQWWAERSIEITGMQALLFGTSGLNLFGEATVQEAMLTHLRSICRIGAGLGARRLVFGSPRNRDRSGLSDSQALEQAVSFFRRLGDIAQAYGVVICLEPNPVEYGANFMTNTQETAAVVTAVSHSAIKMQFDTGAMTLNGEKPAEVLRAYAHLVGHVHISEPHLAPIGDGETDHRAVRDALQCYLPEHVISIEMAATKDEPHIASIRRALTRVVEWYCAR